MPTLAIAQKRLDFAKKAEEHYNALRTNIQLSGDNLKVLSISSVKPGEGKSTTSINIAWTFARAGYKTLLVDADIRNSVMSGVFKSREKITGLTDFLAGTTDLSPILKTYLLFSQDRYHLIQRPSCRVKISIP